MDLTSARRSVAASQYWLLNQESERARRPGHTLPFEVPFVLPLTLPLAWPLVMPLVGSSVPHMFADVSLLDW
jgi:hypothetical protein